MFTEENLLDLKTCTKDKDFIRKVKENIINNSLLEKGDTVICGLSGGADSVVLLDFCVCTVASLGVVLQIVVNFRKCSFICGVKICIGRRIHKSYIN